MSKYNYIKEIIGYLIGYYRLESNKTAKNFVFDNSDDHKEICKGCNHCKDYNKICSQTSLYRIEKGHIVNRNCTYERLANKLGKKVILDNYDIYYHINFIRDELKNSIVDFSKTKLENIEANIELNLKKYQNVLYVEEILSLYLNVVQNVLYGTDIDSKKGQIYLFLRDKVQVEDDKMITFLLYETKFRILNLNGTINDINEQCSKFYEDPLFYKPKLESILYTDLTKILDGYDYLIKYELSKDTLTKYQQYQLYCEIAGAELNLEAYEKCYHRYKKCIHLLEEFYSTDLMKSGSYRFLGRSSFLLEKYEETIDWLMKARNLKESKSIAHDTLFLLASLEYTNQIKKIKEFLNSINVNRMVNKYGKQIVAYYKLKYSSDLSSMKDIVKLENYILDLKPTLDIYGTLHKNVFNEDLKKYVNITGNYKKHFMFNN